MCVYMCVLFPKNGDRVKNGQKGAAVAYHAGTLLALFQAQRHRHVGGFPPAVRAFLFVRLLRQKNPRVEHQGRAGSGVAASAGYGHRGEIQLRRKHDRRRTYQGAGKNVCSACFIVRLLVTGIVIFAVLHRLWIDRIPLAVFDRGSQLEFLLHSGLSFAYRCISVAARGLNILTSSLAVSFSESSTPRRDRFFSTRRRA